MTNEEIITLRAKMIELRTLTDIKNKLEIRKSELLQDDSVKEYLQILEQEKHIRKEIHPSVDISYEGLLDECYNKLNPTIEGDFWLKQDIHFLSLNTSEIQTIRNKKEEKEFEESHNIIYTPEGISITDYYHELRVQYMKEALEHGNDAAQKSIYKLVLSGINSKPKQESN